MIYNPLKQYIVHQAALADAASFCYNPVPAAELEDEAGSAEVESFADNPEDETSF